LPFQHFAQDGPPSGMMVAHMYLQEKDASHPAPYSKKVINDLLKNQLNYSGLVITDDLDMKGALFNDLSYNERVLLSLKAGTDMIMIAWSYDKQDEVIDFLENKVNSGEFSLKDLNSKVSRIIHIKELLNKPKFNTDEFHNLIESKYYRDTLVDIARASYNEVLKKVTARPIKPILYSDDEFTRKVLKRTPSSISQKSLSELSQRNPNLHAIIHIRNKKDFLKIEPYLKVHPEHLAIINTSMYFRVPKKISQKSLATINHSHYHPLMGSIIDNSISEGFAQK
jgi:beta-glucosidase-like glycosyl hydrolase